MSPEYRHWQEIPKEKIPTIKIELEKLRQTIAQAVNEGFAWCEVDGYLCIKKLDELTIGQRTNARKKESPWHVLLPLQNSSHNNLPSAPQKAGISSKWRTRRKR